MRHLIRHSFAMGSLALAAVAAVPLPTQPLASKGPVAVAEDFCGISLAHRWKTVFPSFTIVDGVLRGTQSREDHGAVIETQVPLRDGNLVLELRLRFEGARSIHILCDDKTWKGVHAGHISRVVIVPNQITVYDDKEGVMRNDIYALRKSNDPGKKAEAERLANGRWQVFPLNLETKCWYRFGLEIYGDELRATIDGRPVAFLRSPGLAHARKSDLRINVWGKDGDGLVDDLLVWGAYAPR